MITTIDTLATKESLAQAAARVSHLSGELHQLRTRHQEASRSATDLAIRVTRLEREPRGDGNALATLQEEAQAVHAVQTNIGQTIAVVERELNGARGELHAAKIADLSVRYNSLVQEQNELTAAIEQAIAGIMRALDAKELVGFRQVALTKEAGSSVGVDVAHLRRNLTHELLIRLQGTGSPRSLRSVDWSIKRMAPGGNLLEEVPL